MQSEIKDNSRNEHYETENKKLIEELTAQKERILQLETTLKSTNDKPPRPTSSNKKQQETSNIFDSSRVPTFSNNIFTLEDEDTKSQEFTIQNKNVR